MYEIWLMLNIVYELALAVWPWLLALALQAPGLVAERWFFLAQANHPQNLYYQTVA